MQLQFKSSKFTLVTRGGGESLLLHSLQYFTESLCICITLNDCEVKKLLVCLKKKCAFRITKHIFILIDKYDSRVFIAIKVVEERVKIRLLITFSLN